MTEITETIAWYQSKTVWGGVIAVGAGIAGAFGYTVSADDQSAIIEIATAVAGALGGVIAIYGRVKATRQVG